MKTHTTSNFVRHTARKSALLVLVLCGALAGSALAQSTGHPSILPPGSAPHGKTYGEWSAKHWQWVYSLPIGTATRDCTVPVATALFFPIIDAECATAEGNGTTDVELSACAKGIIDHAVDLSCEIDGIAVQNLAAFRVHSPLFTWGPLPENNVFQDSVNFPAGTTSPSVSDGYFVMVAPLSVGSHTIHFKGSVVFTQAQDGFDFTFSLDITYHLMVTK